MSSLKKNFSIAKLYSDLQKYQTNLCGFKNSRLKKQTSSGSLHRPSSSHKNNQFRENFGHANLSRFEKSKLQVTTKTKYARPTFQKTKDQQKYTFLNDYLNQTDANKVSLNNSYLRQNVFESRQQKQNRKSHNSNSLKFNKSDELYFLSQCNKLYNIKSNQNLRDLNSQQEADSVKTLLNQINKRDKVYDIVTKRLGAQNIQKKLEQFFDKFQRMSKIISQFKKMSKLDIQNEQQLYQFLINEQDEIKQTQKQNIENAQGSQQK